MLDLLLICVLFVLLLIGLRYPAVAFAGYIWADIVAPQNISFGIARSVPYSVLFAGTCVLSMMLNPKQITKPTSVAMIVLIIAFIVWFTITTSWSSFPYPAEFKLDWATKSLGFLVVAFLVINNRNSLELFLLTFVICTAYFALQTGIKTMAGSGGYGAHIIHGGNNNGLSESSTLGGVSIACVPLLLYFKKSSVLFEPTRHFQRVMVLACFLFIASAIGTYSRTGLVCLIVFGIFMILASKKRIKNALITIVAALAVYNLGGEDWRQRMATIDDSSDEVTTVGRTAVWRWTFDYVNANPLGGGFNAYLHNYGALEPYVGENVSLEKLNVGAKAFHSVYFEVLGEQGYPGIILYLSIMLIALAKLKFAQNMHGLSIIQEESDWIRLAATACFTSFVILLIAAMFVGFAYRPYLFVFVIASAVLFKERKKSLVNGAIEGLEK